MNEFTERFKSKTNSELIHIVENPAGFQELAVEAAVAEIKKRDLSDDELKEAEEILIGEKEAALTKSQKKKEQEDKVLEGMSTVVGVFNPIQNGTATDRIITAIVIVFSFMWAYNLYNQFYIFQYTFTTGDFGVDLSLLLILRPLIFLPVAIFLFWKRQKAGWVLLAAEITFKLVEKVYSLILSIGMEPTGVELLDTMFPPVPISSYLITIACWLATLWAIGQRSIRAEFTISLSTMRITIVVTVMLGLSMLLVM